LKTPNPLERPAKTPRDETGTDRTFHGRPFSTRHAAAGFQRPGSIFHTFFTAQGENGEKSTASYVDISQHWMPSDVAVDQHPRKFGKELTGGKNVQ
jgi:hypothetical protein